MSKRYTLPKRVRLYGDKALAATFLSRAESYLGALAERVKKNKLKRGHWEFEDQGVYYILDYNPILPIISIRVTGAGTEIPAVSEVEIWIPRGFVVYPASDTSPFGWGAPIVQISSQSPYVAANLSPGLDVARWTAAGPLGQVLLTRTFEGADGPNYPPLSKQIIPLFYTPDNGLKPTKASLGLEVKLDALNGNYSGFRYSLVDLDAFDATDSKTSMRKIFELTNTHRTSMGLDALNLPLRGLFRTAPQYVKMMELKGTLAHYAAKFWPTYKVPSDRNGKDGLAWLQDGTTSDNRNLANAVGENNYAQAVGGSERIIGTDPNGDDIIELVAIGPVNPTVAFNGWLGSPPHRATIENVLWNHHSTFLDVGVRGGFAAQDFTRRSQWIPCGSTHWYSSHTEVPALSWHSPQSINLAWETWPVSATVDSPAGLRPLTPQNIVDANGRFWINYYFKPPPDDPTVVADDEWVVPALSSAIFMRGRMIACAPHGGLVLGAGIQKLVGGVYRLIALVHVQADQILSVDGHGVYTHGATPVLHVYYVDLPTDNSFAARSQSTVRGIHGAPPTSDPWIDADDTWSWRDAGTLNVYSTDGVLIDLLKYAQFWRFNSDGTKAVCMRDEGTLASYNGLINSYTASLGAFDVIGLVPRTLVLSFSAGAGPLTFSLEVKPLSPIQQYINEHGFVEESMPQIGDAQSVFTQVAVDWAPDGSLNFAYGGHAGLVEFGGTFAFQLQFAGTGPIDIISPSELDNFVYVGSDYRTPQAEAATTRVQVIDVNDGVFVVDGFRPRFAWDGSEGFGANPDFTPCWLYNDAGFHHVYVFRNGEQLHAKFYGNPDGIVVDPLALCDLDPTLHTIIAPLLPFVSNITQASYAKNREGEWVLTYQYSPQPYSFRVIDRQLVACLGADACRPTVFDYFGFDATGSPSGTSHVMSYTEVTPRGGWCAASFADQTQLAALTGTPGDNPRMIYARIV